MHCTRTRASYTIIIVRAISMERTTHTHTNVQFNASIALRTQYIFHLAAIHGFLVVHILVICDLISCPLSFGECRFAEWWIKMQTFIFPKANVIGSVFWVRWILEPQNRWHTRLQRGRGKKIDQWIKMVRIVSECAGAAVYSTFSTIWPNQFKVLFMRTLVIANMYVKSAISKRAMVMAHGNARMISCFHNGKMQL